MKVAPWLKTWSPIIGGLLLIAVAVLRVLGQTAAAEALTAIIGVLGLDQGAVIGLGQAGEIVGAVLLLIGIVRKVIASAQKPAPGPYKFQ